MMLLSVAGPLPVDPSAGTESGRSVVLDVSFGCFSSMGTDPAMRVVIFSSGFARSTWAWTLWSRTRMGGGHLVSAGPSVFNSVPVGGTGGHALVGAVGSCSAVLVPAFARSSAAEHCNLCCCPPIHA